MAGTTTLLTLGAITNSSYTPTFTGSGNFAQTGVWGSGSGGLTLGPSYSGTATLSQANTFTGSTSILGGTLVVAAAAPSGSAGALGNSSAAVLLGNTSGSANALLLIGGAYTVARPVTVQSWHSPEPRPLAAIRRAAQPSAEPFRSITI